MEPGDGGYLALSFGLGCVVTYSFVYKAFVKAVRDQFAKHQNELRTLRAQVDYLREQQMELEREE